MKFHHHQLRCSLRRLTLQAKRPSTGEEILKRYDARQMVKQMIRIQSNTDFCAVFPVMSHQHQSSVFELLFCTSGTLPLFGVSQRLSISDKSEKHTNKVNTTRRADTSGAWNGFGQKDFRTTLQRRRAGSHDRRLEVPKQWAQLREGTIIRQAEIGEICSSQKSQRTESGLSVLFVAWPILCCNFSGPLREKKSEPALIRKLFYCEFKRLALRAP